jgi:hypothetical protein
MSILADTLRILSVVRHHKSTLAPPQRDTTRLPVPDAIRRIEDSEDRTLAWAFFIFFSRMEYALKRSGYLSGTVAAQPNWDRFSSEHSLKFNPDASEQLRTAVNYFIAQPPRKQVQENREIHWKPQEYDEKEPLLNWLLRMIRCVRNNLFHGGKFPLIPISEPSRDREVLLNSLVILQSSLPLDPKVQRQFFADLE